MNCHQCKHHGSLPGNAHICCNHPSVKTDDPLAQLMAIFAGVRRVPPIVSSDAKKLNIKLNPHGVRNGWCNLPWNFDCIWVDECDGFTEC